MPDEPPEHEVITYLETAQIFGVASKNHDWSVLLPLLVHSL
jgi:hypothetical protein